MAKTTKTNWVIRILLIIFIVALIFPNQVPGQVPESDEISNGLKSIRSSLLKVPDQLIIKDKEVEKKVMKEINKRRVELGMTKLEWNSKLARAAKMHSNNMKEKEFFSHTDPSGHDVQYRVIQVGLSPYGVGEVIYKGKRWHGGIIIGFIPLMIPKTEDGYVEDIVQGWMNSPGHHDIIMDPRMDYIGVGREGKYITADLSR